MNVQNIKLNNLGTVNKNAVVITTDKGTVELYFSYQTIKGTFLVVKLVFNHTMKPAYT